MLMNKITLAARFVLAITISATPSTAGTTSDVDVRSGVYKTLCVEGQSTGYKWVDGKWQPVDFTTTKYLIQKVDPTDQMAGKCAQAVPDKPGDEAVRDKPGDDVVDVTACYRIRNLGEYSGGEPPMPIDIFENAVRDTPRST